MDGADMGFRLHTDAFGRLVLTDNEGVEHADVSLVRAFPISNPQGCIAICNPNGRELVWINSLDELSTTERQQVEEHFARGDFLPQICRITKISSPTEPSEWHIESDRGPTRFQINSEHDVRALDSDRALVTDANGIRYLIPSIAALDNLSKRLLERYL